MQSQAQDVEKLRQNLGMLGLAHYAFAGLMVLTGCIFFFHVFFGIATIAMPEAFKDSNTGEPMPVFFGLTMTSIGGCAIAAFWTMALLFALAGGGLRSGRRRMLSLVTAVLMLGSFPLGTIVGVLTLMLLMKPEAKQIYGD